MWMGGRVLLKSDSITELSKALCKFQAEVKNPANSAVNPFYKSKYAPLNEILNDVRPILSKHGLVPVQSLGSADGEYITITTLLLHESGEWLEGDPLTLRADKATPQGAGICSTYGRRYALSAILGISSEDDDDGNGAEITRPAQRTGQPQNQQAQVKQPPATTPPVTTPPQEKPVDMARWWTQAGKLGLGDKEVHTIAGRESLKGMSRAELTELYDKCKIIAAERKGA
jgi:hypothetical protein